LIDATRNILDAAAFKKMKDGMRIINCARGGLIDEGALANALKNGKVKGAALDVFLSEPAKDNPLFDMENVICTPHLGASTSEAQENVAIQVAEQLSAYLNDGEITNALNFPSISAEEAPRLTPFIKLAETLGSFAGQLTQSAITGVRIEYEGDVAGMNVKPMSAAALTGLLRPLLGDVNMVSAPALARERGIVVEVTTREQQGAYENYIRINVMTENQERSVAGTIFGNGESRLIQVKGINMDASFSPDMLYITNADKPGFIGRLGTLLGGLDINIANFNLGRRAKGEGAIALLNIDSEMSPDQLAKVETLEGVTQVQSLRF
jgi:D-3-phosphoglycerate dehydrogenase